MIRLVLLRILETYFRHRWLYLVPAALMFALAGVRIVTTPRIYSAQGSMFVENQSLLNSLTGGGSDFSIWVTPSQSTVDNYNELLRTDAFVRSAIQRTSLEAQMAQGNEAVDKVLKQFRESLTISPSGSNLVTFHAEAKDPQLAQQLVTAAMDSYVLWKINVDYQESVTTQNFFANMIKPLEEQQQAARDELTTYLATYPDPVRGDRPLEEQVELERLRSAVDEATTRLNEARKNEENARLVISKSDTVARQTYQIIDAPVVPQRSELSRRTLIMEGSIFVAVGIILTVVGVIGATVLDRSLRFPLDIQHSLQLPVLALVADGSSLPMSERAAAAANAPGPVQQPASAVKLPSFSATKEG